MKNSEYISGFLEFLRIMGAECRVAKLDEEETDKETQDILHRLELEDDNYQDTLELATALSTIRRKRRIAKDIIAAAEPVSKWAAENSKAIKTLEQCLGETRKTENRLENRHYVAKTDILESILEDDSQ